MQTPPINPNEPRSVSPAEFERKKTAAEQMAQKVLPHAKGKGKTFTANHAPGTKVQGEVVKLAKNTFRAAA